MDNNNSNPTTPAPQPAPAQPVVSPQPQVASQTGDSKKMIIMFVIGFLIVILLAGGIYWYLTKQAKPATEQTTTSAPSLNTVKDALDKELESINVSASEGDFKSMDQDLQSL